MTATNMLIFILNCIALVGYVSLIYSYCKLSRQYKNLSLEYNGLFKEYKRRLFDRKFVDGEVFVREAFDRFEVFRGGKYGSIIISVIEYDPCDPDDKEYKRIHAEEIAEILNEKP